MPSLIWFSLRVVDPLNLFFTWFALSSDSPRLKYSVSKKWKNLLSVAVIIATSIDTDRRAARRVLHAVDLVKNQVKNDPETNQEIIASDRVVQDPVAIYLEVTQEAQVSIVALVTMERVRILTRLEWSEYLDCIRIQTNPNWWTFSRHSGRSSMFPSSTTPRLEIHVDSDSSTTLKSKKQHSLEQAAMAWLWTANGFALTTRSLSELTRRRQESTWEPTSRTRKMVVAVIVVVQDLHLGIAVDTVVVLTAMITLAHPPDLLEVADYMDQFRSLSKSSYLTSTFLLHELI